MVTPRRPRPSLRAQFNHFSLLATIENLFGLHRLGYAGVPGLLVFSTGVFNKYSGG